MEMGNKTKVLSGERVTVYDWLRVIATIFVVIGHSSYVNIQTAYGGVSYELPENFSAAYNNAFLSWCREELVAWVYGFHMPLFFMLSGAVLALKPIKSFDQLFRGKVRRLLIPYFVYGWLFMLPVKRLGHFYTNGTLKLVLRGFLSGDDSGHLWFLTALFWCLIIFAGLLKMFEKLEIKSIYLILLLCGVVQLTYTYIPFDILGLKTGLSYIFYFSLGYAFECERRCHKKWNIKKTILAYVLMLILEILHKKYEVLNPFFIIVTGSFMTYIFADLCDRAFGKFTRTKIWDFIIRNIFYVYLLHDPLEYIVLRLFIARKWLTSAFGCYAYTFSRTVLIFIGTLFMGECINWMKKNLGRLLSDDLRKTRGSSEV